MRQAVTRNTGACRTVFLSRLLSVEVSVPEDTSVWAAGAADEMLGMQQ